nr:MAG TPA: hypothetical protein [Caudoviricetes sp.]
MLIFTIKKEWYDKIQNGEKMAQHIRRRWK